MSSPGFFTGLPPFQLPHPPVPVRLILATHHAIGRAFEVIRSSQTFSLHSANEDEITRYLHTLLEDRFLASGEIAGFNKRRFKNVVRPEVPNHDGTHPAKRPDLIVFLRRENTQSSQDGIFAECKPVDADHPIGEDYCDKGIARFVQGDYAWAMQEAMMIGYVRGGRTIPRDLTPVIMNARRHQFLGSPRHPEIVGLADPQQSVPLYSTTHERTFPWTENRGQAVPIRLFHSWHVCS